MIVLKSISFIVPCFNEEQNVAATVAEIEKAVDTEDEYEIILIDDCSSDRTLERMTSLSSANCHLRVLQNPTNLGLGGSYKRGVAAAKNDFVILIPGDNGFPAPSIRTVLGCMGQADIIIPYVVNSNERHWSRAIISRLFTGVLNAMFWLDVRYYNGIVLHKASLLRTIAITTNGFAYQAEAIIRLIADGASYTHCPVVIRDRATGRSSALKLKNIAQVTKTVFLLAATVGVFRKYRPFSRSLRTSSN